MKEYFEDQWLKKKKQGRLSKRKIILLGAKPIKTKRTKRKRKRIRVFKLSKYGNRFVCKEVKRKNKNKKWQVFRTKR